MSARLIEGGLVLSRRSWMSGLGALALGGCARSGGDVTFATAASLRQVFPKLADAFVASSPGPRCVASYGASGDLAKQVEGGAPIDGVLFASSSPVDDLVTKGRVLADSRAVVATNRLVLIAPKKRAGEPESKPVTFETIDLLGPNARIAIGEPGAVPAGQYAKKALVALGKWDAVEKRLVFGGDVSAVLAYARRGEVEAAIVYETETAGIDDIVVLDRARAPWAPRAEVVGGVVAGAKGAMRARALLGFIASAEGQKILSSFGFGPP